MTLHEHITLDDILRNPPTVRSVHAGHLATLRSGTLSERRDIGHLHVLKLLLGRRYGDVVTDSFLAALRRTVQEGDCDTLTLEEIERANAVTFEAIKGDKVTGLYVYDRGMLVVATHLVDGKPIARTIYSIFNTPEQQRLAGSAQRYMHALAEYAKRRTTDTSILGVLDHLATMEPTYSNGRLVGNFFLSDAKDMHEALKDASPDEKYALLRDKIIVDVVLGHYAKEFAHTMEGKKLARHMDDAIFVPRDHERFLFEKVFLRADSARRNRLVNEGVATEQGKIIDLQRAKALVPEAASLIAAIGLTDSVGMAFVHGDNLPSNTMVSTTRDGRKQYTPIDFEFACVDYLESSLVQCLVKAGIYDHTGVSLRLENRRPLETEVLEDAAASMKRLDPSFDEGAFFERFNALKAENYLLWAARYLHYGKSRRTRDVTGANALMQYYHTLFIKEMIRQGRARDSDDPLFDYTKRLFLEPLNDMTMRQMRDLYLPEQRSHSVLKTTFEVDAEAKLDEMIGRHRSSQRRRKFGVIGGIVAASALVLGLAFTAGNYKARLEEYQYKVETTELKGDWDRQSAFLLSLSDPRLETQTEVYKLLQGKYGQGNTALAAVYAPDLVKRAVQHHQSVDWTDIEGDLPHLLVQQIRLYSSNGYVDSWMRMSSNHPDGAYAPPFIDSSAQVFNHYNGCFDPNGEPCLPPESERQNATLFGDNTILLATLKSDPWYKEPFKPEPPRKLPVGPMFGGP